MGTMSVWHWLIFLAVALLLFGGKGKISSIMGDVADGIKSFKKGMQDDAAQASDKPKAIDVQTGKPVDTSTNATQTKV